MERERECAHASVLPTPLCAPGACFSPTPAGQNPALAQARARATPGTKRPFGHLPSSSASGSIPGALPAPPPLPVEPLDHPSMQRSSAPRGAAGGRRSGPIRPPEMSGCSRLPAPWPRLLPSTAGRARGSPWRCSTDTPWLAPPPHADSALGPRFFLVLPKKSPCHCENSLAGSLKLASPAPAPEETRVSRLLVRGHPQSVAGCPSQLLPSCCGSRAPGLDLLPLPFAATTE